MVQGVGARLAEVFDEGAGTGGGLGQSCFVMACMLASRSEEGDPVAWIAAGAEGIPVERASDHEQIVARELDQASVKLAVVYETAGLADYEEGEDNPAMVSIAPQRNRHGKAMKASHMVVGKRRGRLDGAQWMQPILVR